MARSESLCKGTKLFPQHLLFKTLVSFIKDLKRRDPLSPLQVSPHDQAFLFFSGFGFDRASGGRGAPGWVQKALERARQHLLHLLQSGAGSPRPQPPFQKHPDQGHQNFLVQKSVCVSKEFPKTSTQTKLDSQQQRNQMRTNEENDSVSGTMVPPGR